jgi:hypothetical protein
MMAADLVLARAIVQFETFVSEPHDPPCGYRLDIQQLWVTCSGDHEITPERLFGCSNPGVVISIDMDDPEQPFLASLGPWELMRSNSLVDLYETTVDTLIPTVLVATLHLHMFGVPCWEECSLCEDFEENEESEE